MEVDESGRRVGYVRARLRVVAVEAGGPADGVADRSQPNWGIGQRLSGDGLLGRAPITVEGAELIAPGATGIVRVHPADWDAWADVRPGDTIPMLDGPRIVGVAEVIEVVRPGSAPKP